MSIIIIDGGINLNEAGQKVMGAHPVNEEELRGYRWELPVAV